MFATVKKITEIDRTRVIEDDWTDEYTEGMELLGGERIKIRPMVIDGRTSEVWFEGNKVGMEIGNKAVFYNWHISWLKYFQER